MFNHLHELLDQLPFDVKSSLVYIAGYVSRKDNEDDDDTFLHYGTYGNFTSASDRGGLKIPNDTYCEWVFLRSFCLIMLAHQAFVDILCPVYLWILLVLTISPKLLETIVIFLQIFYLTIIAIYVHLRQTRKPKLKL